MDCTHELAREVRVFDLVEPARYVVLCSDCGRIVQADDVQLQPAA